MDTIAKEQIKIWENKQIEMSKKFSTKDRIINIQNIDYIGAFYMYISKKDETVGCAVFLIYDFTSSNIVYRKHKIIKNKIPYISGYIGFREVPHFVDMYRDMLKFKASFTPDVIILNSFGKLHPRKAGSALQLALAINMPVIGVGKSLITVDGLEEAKVRYQFKDECSGLGEYIEIIGKSGTNYGAAVKTGKSSNNPLYVTIGSYISLETAIDIVINCSKHRLPEPVRRADIYSKNMLQQYKDHINTNEKKKDKEETKHISNIETIDIFI